MGPSSHTSVPSPKSHPLGVQTSNQTVGLESFFHDVVVQRGCTTESVAHRTRARWIPFDVVLVSSSRTTWEGWSGWKSSGTESLTEVEIWGCEWRDRSVRREIAFVKVRRKKRVRATVLAEGFEVFVRIFAVNQKHPLVEVVYGGQGALIEATRTTPLQPTTY